MSGTGEIGIRDPEYLKEEIVYRTEFIEQVIEQLALRGNGRQIERFQRSGNRMVLTQNGKETGYIERWEIKAVIKELMERCAK